MTASIECIFCDSALSADTKPEHILLEALGGKKTTRLAICSGCNNKFGGTIDYILAGQVQALRNLLQFQSGRQAPAPTQERPDRQRDSSTMTAGPRSLRRHSP